MTIHRDPAPLPRDDEAYVREVLGSAMAGTRPPLDLSRAAIARGRRRRTSRRLVVATGVAAAGALVAVAAPWLAADPDRAAGRGRDLVATEPPVPQPERASGWWDVPSADMVAAVEAILPDGVRVTDPGSLEADTPEGGPAHGWINAQLDAPSGPGRLNVVLAPDPSSFTVADDPTMPAGEGRAPGSGPVEAVPGEPDPTSCDEVFSGQTTCVQLRDDDGSIVGRRLTNRWGGTVTNEVVLRRDGGTIYAASANTLDDKWDADSPVSAERPPLTLNQLEDLVRNDVWVTGPGT